MVSFPPVSPPRPYTPPFPNPYAPHVITPLTFTLLMWRIWWAPNNVCKWRVGFNSAFKALITKKKNLLRLKELDEEWRPGNYKVVSIVSYRRFGGDLRFLLQSTRSPKRLRKVLVNARNYRQVVQSQTTFIFVRKSVRTLLIVSCDSISHVACIKLPILIHVPAAI